MTLLTSKQQHWTTNLPEEYIHTRLQKILKKFLLAQVPTIACKNVDKPNNAKDTCTINCHEFKGLTTSAASNFFCAAAIQTLHKNLTAVDYK
jgi:hypothetical protein